MPCPKGMAGVFDNNDIVTGGGPYFFHIKRSPSVMNGYYGLYFSGNGLSQKTYINGACIFIYIGKDRLGPCVKHGVCSGDKGIGACHGPISLLKPGGKRGKMKSRRAVCACNGVPRACVLGEGRLKGRNGRSLSEMRRGKNLKDRPCICPVYCLPSVSNWSF